MRKNITLRWSKNRFGRWETHYKRKIIECDSQGKFFVNGMETKNGTTIWTIVNVLDEACYVGF